MLPALKTTTIWTGQMTLSQKNAREVVKWNCGQVQRVLFQIALPHVLVSFGWAICIDSCDIPIIQQASGETCERFDESVNQTAIGEANTPILDKFAPVGNF